MSMQLVLYILDYSLIDLTFSENEASHTGIDSGVGTMHDLLTLIQAAHIHQASVYHWNSGFSNIAHNIFDVPTTTYPQIL